jgi:hypothetical protein
MRDSARFPFCFLLSLRTRRNLRYLATSHRTARSMREYVTKD